MKKFIGTEEPVAIIGFSVNPEIIAKFPRISDKEKEQFEGMTCQLAGTSANVASALAKFGMKTILFALTGHNSDFHTHCLHYVIENPPPNISIVNFPILEKGHMGFVPIDGIKETPQVFGSKGTIQQEKIRDCIQIIKKEKRNIWRIATGVRPQEVELVKALFGEEHRGFRYLNPRMDLIREKEIFFELLKQTDVLVINHAEYEACCNHKEINSRADIQKKFGVSLVIVTKDEDGCKYSLLNDAVDVTEKFDACMDYINEGTKTFSIGVGDWFAGALIYYFVKKRKSVLEITGEEIRDAVYLATRIAGKKVTMRGAGNGPSESDL